MPGLPGDRYHALAKKYVPKGAGAVLTFGLKGGYDAGVKLVSNVKLFSHLANIGDTRSLIIHPGLDHPPAALRCAEDCRRRRAGRCAALRSGSKTRRTSSPTWSRRWRQRERHTLRPRLLRQRAVGTHLIDRGRQMLRKLRKHLVDRNAEGFGKLAQMLVAQSLAELIDGDRQVLPVAEPGGYLRAEAGILQLLQ